jgi:hypothetical protein
MLGSAYAIKIYKNKKKRSKGHLLEKSERLDNVGELELLPYGGFS